VALGHSRCTEIMGINLMLKSKNRSILAVRKRDAVQSRHADRRNSPSAADFGLTRRQLKVLALMVQGKSNKAICRALDLAEPTVKYHVTGILRALKVTNRTEAVVAANGLGWKPDGSVQAGAPAATATVSLRPSALPLPEKPSIVVLPFVNLGVDQAQEYFSDGVVEDITIALGCIPWLFVIGSASAFTYKGRLIDDKRIGEELGVRYALRGTIRRSTSRLRITVQLTDIWDGNQIWADRIDSSLDDVFDLQDRLAVRVCAMVAPTMRSREIARVKRKPTSNLSAYDLVLQALPHCRMYNSDNEIALELLYRAIELDPCYGAAYGLAALSERGQLMVRRRLPTDPRVAEGIRLACLAVEHGGNDPEALWMAGETIFMLGGDIERGQALINQSVQLNSNSASAWNALGIVLAYSGEPDIALEHFTRARRLDPVHSFHHNYWVGCALAHFMATRYRDASEAADVVLNERPDYPRALGLMAASCGLLGKVKEGRKWVEKLCYVNPQATVSAFRAIYEAPMRNNLLGLESYLDGLRRSGTPEN
jgi:TolB-like protein/DNA-binding CsgD family transcriptional regulator